MRSSADGAISGSGKAFILTGLAGVTGGLCAACVITFSGLATLPGGVTTILLFVLSGLSIGSAIFGVAGVFRPTFIAGLACGNTFGCGGVDKATLVLGFGLGFAIGEANGVVKTAFVNCGDDGN